MNVDEMIASAHTKYSIELASSEALRSLVEQCNPKVARMLWLLGYSQGRFSALEDILKETP